MEGVRSPGNWSSRGRVGVKPRAYRGATNRLRGSRPVRPSLRSGLQPLARPTAPSADFSLRHPVASPFQAQSEISLGKTVGLHRTTAGFTPRLVGRESFAASCQLALIGSASYPISVRRLTVSVHASFGPRGDALALPFGPCGQVPEGLSPSSRLSCQAHTNAAPRAIA